MATVIAVHGTYANAGTTPGVKPAEGSEPQWWQPESTFERNIRDLVDAQDGHVEVTHFPWSGDNSELGRREAGYRLFKRLRELEAKKEPYCLVGHSHGGSVISAALLESAARRQKLEHLRRWITIGTPFVKLRKERLLFDRLGLIAKVILVASLMLFLMFFFNLFVSLIGGERMLFGRTFPGVLIATGVMMCLPAILCYLTLKYFDSRALLQYRPRIRARARETFGSRWLSLTHSDDEAVQGLTFLPEAKLSFFDKSFAVPTITLASVVALPLLYLFVLLSPPIMVKIGDWLKTTVYEARTTPEMETAVRDLQQRLRAARRVGPTPAPQSGAEQQTSTPVDRQAVWRDYRMARRDLEERYPDLPSAERALRFKQRFFEQDGKPCEGGQLCGGGHDLRINSGLILHLATDELSWTLGADDVGTRWQRWFWSLLVPAVLVPVVSGIIALMLMLVIQWAARVVSSVSSSMLNSLTNAEVKRAAFGNDTEGEIALGANDRPMWLDRSPPRLPAAVADLITNLSNGVASQSIAKFRRAIGQLASVSPPHTADSAITTYFTWKELVHASYFEVPEFRKLVARAVSSNDGFAPSSRFQADADFAKTTQWFADIENAPGTTRPPESAAPKAEDAAAVSAAVASTVKAEP